jgi:hypothetical protein
MNCFKVDYMLFDYEENNGDDWQLTKNKRRVMNRSKINQQVYNDRTYDLMGMVECYLMVWIDDQIVDSPEIF